MNEQSKTLALRSQMRIQHLVMLMKLIEAGTVRGAASSLCLSQSAVTKSLRDLEALVGAPLFERASSGITPTRYCPPLERFARDTLSQLDAALQEVQNLLLGNRDKVCIGVDVGMAEEIIGPIVLSLQRELTGITISVRSGTTLETHRRLEAGDLDFALTAATVGVDRAIHSFVRVQRERIVSVVRPSHPLAQEPAVSTARLVEAMWILPPRSDPVRVAVGKALLSEGVDEPTDYLEVTSPALTLSLLRSSDLVAACEAQRVAPLVAAGELTELHTAFAYDDFQIGLLRVRRRVLRPASSILFSGFIRELRSRSRSREALR